MVVQHYQADFPAVCIKVDWAQIQQGLSTGLTVIPANIELPAACRRESIPQLGH